MQSGMGCQLCQSSRILTNEVPPENDPRLPADRSPAVGGTRAGTAYRCMTCTANWIHWAAISTLHWPVLMIMWYSSGSSQSMS
ncbi:hypothetical protein LARV_03765 [Longilinea arvoryzae]|uniref:Uncharacterized protein n=1 Tax=Longilinea arvoryzae TaxID=360412 RepID=A0A0K8MXP1_9CHLR|nr:hypothetical protein LARV_03765 [Longilinea arvoryzae]